MNISAEKQTQLIGHKWQVSCLEFSPDGIFLASGAWDKCVRIWDLSILDSVVTLEGHDGPVTCLAWRPADNPCDFGIIATGSADNTAKLWDSANGKKLETLQNHTGWVLGTSFTSGGDVLATSSWDKSVSLWNVTTAKLTGALHGHSTGVWTCAFQPQNSSSLLCSGAEDGILKLWDMRSNSAVQSLVGGHDDSVKSCSWSPDGQYIASASVDNKIVVWEPRSGAALAKCRGHEDAVTCVKFFPKITSSSVPVLFSTGDFTCRIWHPWRKRNKQLFSLKPHKPGYEVETLALTPDGTLLATAGRDKDVVLSSVYLSLDEVDALPVDDQIDNHGAMLWRKYTRKVMQRSRSEGDSIDWDTPIRDVASNSAPKVSAGLVDRAIHRHESQSRLQVEKGDKDGYPDVEHSQNEDLLKAQIKKLRPRGSSDPGSKPEVVKVSANHITVHRNNSNTDANEFEQMRNRLKHVHLEEADGVTKISKPMVNGQITNGDVRHSHLPAGGLVNGVADRPVVMSNGNFQHNPDPDSYIKVWNDGSVFSSPMDTETWSFSNQHNVIPNGDIEKIRREPEVITIGAKKRGFDMYHGQDTKYNPSSFGHSVYDKNRNENAYSFSGGSSPMRSGIQSVETGSVSSSSYYADIEDIAKEMYELAEENEKL